MIWLVDGNNVMGSRPDGWWNDPAAAQARLAQEVAEWARAHDDEVVLVFDGGELPEVAELAGGNLRIEFAPRRRRNAADDHIVARAAESYGDRDLTVVTADRGLVARLPPGVGVEGPRRFRSRLG